MPSSAVSSTSPATRDQTPTLIRSFASRSVRMPIPWHSSRTPITRITPRRSGMSLRPSSAATLCGASSSAAPMPRLAQPSARPNSAASTSRSGLPTDSRSRSEYDSGARANDGSHDDDDDDDDDDGNHRDDDDDDRRIPGIISL